MPQERREVEVADLFAWRRARLAELAGDPPDLHDGEGRAPREDGRHLQEDLETLPDRRSGEIPERLRAVAGLEQERAARTDLRERRDQRPGLAGEHERRKRSELLARRPQLRFIRPLGLMARLK